jgi:hypothetical protein
MPRIKIISLTKLDPAVDPIANYALHEQAEKAALAAYLTAGIGVDPTRRMDRAAAKVFRDAGTPREAATFYAGCVTALVLERIHHQSGKN